MTDGGPPTSCHGVSDLRRRRQNQHRRNSFRAGQPQQTVANPGEASHQPRRRQGRIAEASPLRDPDQSLGGQPPPGFTPPGIIHRWAAWASTLEAHGRVPDGGAIRARSGDAERELASGDPL
jgi:hypothetical protein